jgi:hypothetical protein
VRGVEADHMVRYCGTLGTERQEKQRKQTLPKWHSHSTSTRPNVAQPPSTVVLRPGPKKEASQLRYLKIQNKAKRHPKVSFRPPSRNPVCFTKRTQILRWTPDACSGLYLSKQTQISAFSLENQVLPKKQTQIETLHP